MSYLQIHKLQISDSSTFWAHVEVILLVKYKIPFERLGFQKDGIGEYVVARIHLGLLYT